jgi:hypothetical protein
MSAAPSSSSVRDVIADAITYHPGNRAGTPDARHPVSLVLADGIIAALRAHQPNHVLHFGVEGWTLQHSMACRLEGRLLDCRDDAGVRLALHRLRRGRGAGAGRRRLQAVRMHRLPRLRGGMQLGSTERL